MSAHARRIIQRSSFVARFIPALLLLAGSATTTAEPANTREHHAVIEDVTIRDGQLLNLSLTLNNAINEVETHFLNAMQIDSAVPPGQLGNGDIVDIRRRYKPASDALDNVQILRRYLRRPARLSWHSHGDIAFGSELATISAAQVYLFDNGEGCAYVKVAGYPDATLMVIDDLIVRSDSDDIARHAEGTPFANLITAPATFVDWRQQHPDIETAEHEYQAGHYLYWFNAKRTHAMVAEYTEQGVTALRAGIVPAVLYIEGCS